MNEKNPPVERPVIENIKTKKKRMENVQNNTQQAEKLAQEKVINFKNMNSVRKFKSLIKEGPYFICVICHRGLYKRSVISFPGVAVVHLQNSYQTLKDHMMGVFIFENLSQ